MIIDGLAAKLSVRLVYESKIHAFYGEMARSALPERANLHPLSLAKTSTSSDEVITTPDTA